MQLSDNNEIAFSDYTSAIQPDRYAVLRSKGWPASFTGDGVAICLEAGLSCLSIGLELASSQCALRSAF